MGITEYPWTVNFAIRKAAQIESFMELPKDKIPPKSLWDNQKELDEWLENVMENRPTTANISFSENEVEG